MIAENVNTHAHGEVHLVVLAHLHKRWSLSGRDGFGEFSKVFFTVFSAPDAGFGGTRCSFSEHRTLATHPVNTLCCNLAGTKHWMLRCCCTGRWSGTIHASGGYVTSEASLNPHVHRTQWRPLTHRRTRLLNKNCLWLLTGVHRTLGVGLWVLGVRRVRCSLKRPLNFERARHMARYGAPDAAECVRCLCVEASGALDFFLTALFEGVSLYIHVWPAKGIHSWTFWHPNILLSLAYSLSLIFLAWLTNQSEFEWSQVHLLVSLHLVDTWVSIGYGIPVTLNGCHHLDGLEAVEE
jgi:hypothetical protein